MKNTIKISICFFVLGLTTLMASPQADGASFCADQNFDKPMKYVAIKDANTYFDSYAEGYTENAKLKGKKVKKGLEVKVYAIGKNCNAGKTIFMNTDDIGFTGVKASDFKKVD